MDGRRRAQNRRGGLFIAGIGIPACGKSSVLRELARLLDAKGFYEPEERQWPPAVTERDTSGRLASVMWFRAIRVPYYYQADAERKDGRIAIVDSYYDKLCLPLLGKRGMEWLIPRRDPYFDIVKAVAELDWERLPLADVIVAFEVVDEETWRKLVKKRNRATDAKFGFDFGIQPLYRKAADRLAREQQPTKVIRFVQTFDSPKASALRLAKQLNEADLINWSPSQQEPRLGPHVDPRLIRRLRAAARKAHSRCYPRYSGHTVIAAVETIDGKIFGGSNVEIANYSLTKHAEEAAVTAAIAAGAPMDRDSWLRTIYVLGGAPCGSCRQFLWEFAALDAIVVIDDEFGSVKRVAYLRDIFPEPFGPADLGVDLRPGKPPPGL